MNHQCTFFSAATFAVEFWLPEYGWLDIHEMSDSSWLKYTLRYKTGRLYKGKRQLLCVFLLTVLILNQTWNPKPLQVVGVFSTLESTSWRIILTHQFVALQRIRDQNPQRFIIKLAHERLEDMVDEDKQGQRRELVCGSTNDFVCDILQQDLHWVMVTNLQRLKESIGLIRDIFIL